MNCFKRRYRKMNIEKNYIKDEITLTQLLCIINLF